MRRALLVSALVGAASLLPAAAAMSKQPTASDPGFLLEQNAALVHPGHHSHTAVQLTTTQTPFTWGAVQLDIPSGVTLSWLNNLSTDYRFTLGSCWGGSPRFEAWVTDPTGTRHKIFFYIGPPPSYTGCAIGAWANTGNLASPSSPVDDDQLGGGYYDTFASVVANYGTYPLTAVWLDADGGWQADQTVEFDNAQVNGRLFTFEG